MNDISASIGLGNLKDIQKLLNKNRKNAQYLKKKLNIKVLNQHENGSFWLFLIKIKNKNEFIDYMKNNGIQASQVHARNDIMSVVDKYQEDLPLLDELEKELVAIPCGWWLNKKDLDYIIISIRNYLKIK